MTQISKRKSRPARRVRCCGRKLDDAIEPRFFKALCDPNRVALLVRLAQCGGDRTVGGVAECCAVDMSVVSRHLALLRDAGILEAHKEGKEVYSRVRYQRGAATLRAIADCIDACCPPGRSTACGQAGGKTKTKK